MNRITDKLMVLAVVALGAACGLPPFEAGDRPAAEVRAEQEEVGVESSPVTPPDDTTTTAPAGTVTTAPAPQSVADGAAVTSTEEARQAMMASATASTDYIDAALRGENGTAELVRSFEGRDPALYENSVEQDIVTYQACIADEIRELSERVRLSGVRIDFDVEFDDVEQLRPDLWVVAYRLEVWSPTTGRDETVSYKSIVTAAGHGPTVWSSSDGSDSDCTSSGPLSAEGQALVDETKLLID